LNKIKNMTVILENSIKMKLISNKIENTSMMIMKEHSIKIMTNIIIIMIIMIIKIIKEKIINKMNMNNNKSIF